MAERSHSHTVMKSVLLASQPQLKPVSWYKTFH